MSADVSASEGAMTPATADRSRASIAFVVAALLALVSLTASGAAAAASRSKAIGLSVSGNHLVNARGQRVRLLGFNNSGAEDACIQGWGMFDVDTATNTSVPTSHVAAMARWTGANAVRVSLNEQCWLGIGGVKHQYG